MAVSPYIAHIRHRIGTDLLVVPTVAVLPRDENGRILLVRLSDSGQWATIGGTIEPDESPEDAARREVKRHDAAGHLRRRPRHLRPHPGRGRRRGPLRHQGPVRVLQRHCAYRCVLWRPDPPPAVAVGQSPAEPRTAHGRGHPAALPNSAGRRYYERKRLEGKTPKEALRCLKRRLSHVVYRQLIIDAATIDQWALPTTAAPPAASVAW